MKRRLCNCELNLQALYVEALYTITHKVGKEECESRENLYKYVRSAFQGDAQLHNALMEKAKQNKVWTH